MKQPLKYEKKVSIGIDNGKTGGICVLDWESNKIIEKIPMPTLGGSGKENAYDVPAIASFLSSYLPEIVVLEKTLILGPMTSKAGAMSSGHCLGLLEGICTTLNYHYLVVSPKEWQKIIFAGMDKFKDTKKTALLFANRMQPQEDWKKSARSSLPHDGMIDAYCLATYGKTLLKK